MKNLDKVLKKMSQVLGGINQRCYNDKCPTFKYYGKKGIKNYLDVVDLLSLWIDAKAWKMHRPSIDRIDSASHYKIENCRFIPLRENIKNMHKEKTEKKAKARKLIMEMAKRRKADCKETGIVVKKRIAELMKNGKS